MQKSAVLCALALVFCAALGVTLSARAASNSPACPTSNKALDHLTKLSARPCIAAMHEFNAEASYYQNASKVNKTNVAAYPDARFAYGLTSHLQLFYDAPTEIAESRFSLPSYFMRRPGYGFGYELASAAGAAYTLTGEISPPSSALANPRQISTAEVGGGAFWPLHSGAEYGLELGALQFNEGIGAYRRVSPIAQMSLSQPLSEKTLVTFALGLQSHSFYNAGAQTDGVLAGERELSSQLLFTAQLGTAFNSSADSKPHYIGFGFIVY